MFCLDFFVDFASLFCSFCAYVCCRGERFASGNDCGELVTASSWLSQDVTVCQLVALAIASSHTG